ncbi:zinc dependent phospholipase C family protein [Halobacillus sp. Marseille-Q1614]|uniref:zinc dependent phospholipase C family protein n=1 Tax=Halobacillus sp. Marseille-Q1614 TaxID=2709134 RepID=UPI001570E76B|nr:zinc dependent phospholipase C family protein [Halobacillus sp. Marseille-Q1614]
MPNIWTHILFAEDLCKKLDRYDVLNTSSRYLYLGAQGPDPLFYYNFWPNLPDRGVPQLGTKMHTENCGAFLLQLIAAGKSLKNQGQAYILGFVTHHILDRNTHPYVHYKSGYEGHNHQKLEVAIDTLMLEKHRHIEPWSEPVHTKIRLMKQERKLVSAWLSPLITKHYDVEKLPNNYLAKSFRDITIAQSIFYDPYGWKKRTIGAYISPYSHQPIIDPVDYLNEKKSEWRHSATNEPQFASFQELYNGALKEAAPLVEEILSYWSSPSDNEWEKIKCLVKNDSYDTGKPLSLQLKNVYSNPIV